MANDPEESLIERLKRENTILRGLVSKLNIPCVYCGLTNMGECRSGFPGCAQADDIMCADDEVFVRIHEENKKLRAENDATRAILTAETGSMANRPLQDLAKLLVEFFNQVHQDREVMLRLVPTTAQAMVYFSLLRDYHDLESLADTMLEKLIHAQRQHRIKFASNVKEIRELETPYDLAINNYTNRRKHGPSTTKTEPTRTATQTTPPVDAEPPAPPSVRERERADGPAEAPNPPS